MSLVDYRMEYVRIVRGNTRFNYFNFAYFLFSLVLLESWEKSILKLASCVHELKQKFLLVLKINFIRTKVCQLLAYVQVFRQFIQQN